MEWKNRQCREEVMSKGAITLTIVLLGTAGTVFAVHLNQKRELQRLKEGVMIELERERYRQLINTPDSTAGTSNEQGKG